ncbi:MAG: hypothetical protein WHS89_04505 [Acidimicrobiales bacterium]
MEQITTSGRLAELDPDRRDLSLPAIIARRVSGAFPLDEWGFDRELAVAVAAVTEWLPRPRVRGGEQLPEVGSALVVADRRLALWERLVLATAVANEAHRPVRFAGVPDVAPLGPLLRRVGGVPESPADLRGLLRSGEVVLTAPGFDVHRPLGAGRPPEAALAVALATGAPVLPLRVGVCLPGRRREVILGEPLRTRGPSSVRSVAELVFLLGVGHAADSSADER